MIAGKFNETLTPVIRRCESRIIDEYAKDLDEPIRKSKWGNQLRGFILGFSNSNFFFAYGICYFYGSTIIINTCPDELDIMDVFRVAIAVLQGGAMVGISFQGNTNRIWTL